MRTVVVTGGAGFLGSHLCDSLVGDNKVICVDNLFTGRKENISHLMDNRNFRFINHDIIEPLFLDCDKIDQIYNLACPASPPHYQHNAIRTIKANVMGTINMLGLAKRHQARILQASTSEVYGDPTQHPQKETYRGNVNPIGPRACYDEGKRCAETLMFDYHRQNDIDIRVIRIFNTYGPRMDPDDGRVISNFITQGLKNEDITIYGAGNQTRSFCFVSDLIDGMIKMMENKSCVGPLNLGNPIEYRIIDLAKKIIDLTGSRSELAFKELPEDDPKERQPDISLAAANLAWKPTIGLEDGLKKTIGYFRQVI